MPRATCLPLNLEINKKQAMKTWKDRAELMLTLLGKSIYRHPVLYLFGTLLVVGALASELHNLRFDTSTEGFLNPHHPALVTYNEFRDQFGRDELIMVGVEADNILDGAFLKQFRALFEQLEAEIPYTESVDSMINARYIYGADDELIVEDLFEPWPETAAAITTQKQKIEANPLYKRLFLSPDYKMATIIIRLRYLHNSGRDDTGEPVIDVDQQINEVLTNVHRVVEEHRGHGLTIHLAGSPIITELLKQLMVSDMQVFVKIVLAIITGLLLIMFRRITGVLLPMLVVILAVVTTVSLMSAFNQPIQLPTAIVPSFLLSVGIGDSIHFLSLFYRQYDLSGDKEKSLIEALEHTGIAMFLTSFTTAAGLGSFATADLLPIANLGIFTSIGVMLAFIYTIIVLPATLSLAPIKPRKSTAKKPADTHVGRLDLERPSLLDRGIDTCCELACSYPKTIVFTSLVLGVAGVVLALGLHFTHNPMAWLPDDLPIKQSTLQIDKQLGGSITVEVVMDTGKEGGVYDPNFLAAVDQLSTELSNYETDHFKVAKVLSITDLLKESNRALHGNNPAFYQIPDSRDLVAQELFLLELSGAEDLFRLVDRNYQMARLTITIPWIDTLLHKPLMIDIDERLKNLFPPEIHTTVTGLAPLLGSTLESVIHSTAKSYLIALVIISITMIFLLESVKYGLLSMLPNVLPIIVVLGIMKINGVPLDMFTMLIGSIAIGLCVDDTVHFMHHFRRYLNRGYNVRQSIEHTLHTAGKAMLVTSIVLCSGFLVLILSLLKSTINFGIYTSLSIGLALFADFLLAPALMVLFTRPKGSGPTPDTP